MAPAMGNHLIDLTGPEFNGQRFTRSWIFGIYDGRITYYEEMLSRDYLLSKPDTCNPIKAAAAVGQAGYYPTRVVRQVRRRARHVHRVHRGLRTPGTQRPGAAGPAGPATAPHSLISRSPP